MSVSTKKVAGFGRVQVHADGVTLIPDAPPASPSGKVAAAPATGAAIGWAGVLQLLITLAQALLGSGVLPGKGGE